MLAISDEALQLFDFLGPPVFGPADTLGLSRQQFDQFSLAEKDVSLRGPVCGLASAGLGILETHLGELLHEAEGDLSVGFSHGRSRVAFDHEIPVEACTEYWIGDTAVNQELC